MLQTRLAYSNDYPPSKPSSPKKEDGINEKPDELNELDNTMERLGLTIQDIFDQKSVREPRI
jgi:hypothetical protein